MRKRAFQWNLSAGSNRHHAVRAVALERTRRNRLVRAAIAFIVAVAAVLAVFLIAPSPAQKKASAATVGTEAAIGDNWTVTVTQSPENPVAVGASVTYTYKLVNKTGHLQFFGATGSADKGSVILTDSACPDANMKITNYRAGAINYSDYTTWHSINKNTGVNKLFDSELHDDV